MTYLILAFITIVMALIVLTLIKNILSDDSMELETESALSEEDYVLNRLPSN